MDFKSINEKREKMEKEYCIKLEEAQLENNYDKVMGLFFELKYLRSFYNKKIKYIEKRDNNKLIRNKKTL